MSKGVPWVFSNCGLCGRKLTTDKSRENGYGPTCLRKVEAEKAKDQLNISDYLEKPGT